jgi:hypothetical protein
MPFFLSTSSNGSSARPAPALRRAALVAFVATAGLAGAATASAVGAAGCGSSSVAPLGGPYGGTTTPTPPGTENTTMGPSSGGASDN